MLKIKSNLFPFFLQKASGLTNTAYSQFRLEQLNQTNNNRTAILKNNEIFDYDRPGMREDISMKFQNILFSIRCYTSLVFINISY